MSIRQRELSRLAYDLEMTYQPAEEWGLVNQLADFRLFRRGRSRSITHLLRRQSGMFDMDVQIFDYKFVTGFGKSRRIWRQTVFFMESKKLGLPQFFMKPENLFHQVGTWLGMQDIDFEEYPEFSRQYLLQGEDEELVRQALSDKLLHFFTIEKNWTLEGLNYYLVFYRKNHLLPPGQIRLFFHKGLEICKLLSEWR